MVTSRRTVRWTLRWFSYLDDLTTHEDHFSCDRDGNSAIRHPHMHPRRATRLSAGPL
jgi:hypothetical protein